MYYTMYIMPQVYASEEGTPETQFEFHIKDKRLPKISGAFNNFKAQISTKATYCSGRFYIIPIYHSGK